MLAWGDGKGTFSGFAVTTFPTRVFLGLDCEDAVTYILLLISYL